MKTTALPNRTPLVSKFSWIQLQRGCPILWLAAASLCPFSPDLAAQPTGGDDGLRAGKHFIQTEVYSLEEDRAVLKRFEGLRVADVSDGMDAVGLQDIGLVNPEIHPLWKDASEYAHRVIGIAVTARYVPTQDPPAGDRLNHSDFDDWVGDWYTTKSSEPFVPLLREGSVLVIEEAPETDVGSIGSNNILSWKLKGCVGVITSGTARDTDEIITQKIPLYYRKPGRGIRPGRNEVESVNCPIVCGGVLVKPGDVVVADGDGVVVVPRKHASRVAAYAHETIEKDKAGRRNLYQKLGLPADDSVK